MYAPQIISVSAHSLTYTTLVNLKKNLLSEYDADNRPVVNPNHTVTVKIDISVNQVIELNAAEQTLFVSLWVRQEWKDEILTWNESEHANITSFDVAIDSIWNPDTTIYNDVREEERDVSGFPATVHSDGKVTWGYPLILKSSCLMDINYFPYDKQACPVKFGSWHFHGYQLDLRNKSATGDQTSFVPNGEWQLMAAPAIRTSTVYGCCPEPYPDVTFYLIMCRKPLYYLYNLILPCIVVLSMTAVSFYLPVESGEKVSFGVTAVLAMMVFLQLVSDLTPTQSEVVPVLSMYLGIVLLLLCISTMSSIVVSNIHFSGERGHEMPNWMRKLVLGFLGTIVCKRKAIKTALDEDAENVFKLEPIHSESRNGRPRLSSNGDIYDSIANGSIYSIRDSEKPRYPTHFSDSNPYSSQDEMSLHGGSGNPTANSAATTRVLRQILSNLKGEDCTGREKKAAERLKTEWEMVAVVIDRLVLYTFLILSTVATIWFFANTPPCDDQLQRTRYSTQ
ncbi:neuronal acetylcholine receptor subunit alpha-9 [Lingula anatina]|uniref:Neuronal acetylcholine receptor subunit alpha-9 n=1 Tax=Lingula anatina TaxID=7574 RepID=A0A1S3H6Q3_LINAN|nr:neuronal acetylcholine receptor subunit alpha-9 [Lingula anatina]|eukprot:XP_013380809.1 neuronal acetylcholine receptor subunit alpha-9 [Lingula anatina]